MIRKGFLVDALAIKNHKAGKHARHEFEVEVSPTEMRKYFDIAYAQLAPTVEIKGFRRGTAPRVMTIQRIGQERYFQAALDLALPNTYAEACRQLDIKPVSPPEISVVSYGEGAPFTYRVAVDVIPDVDPGQYAKLKVKAPKLDASVKADEVNEVLERLRKQQADVQTVDRAAKKGDRVEIDYVGLVKNVKRDDLSSQHFPVILGDGVLPKKLEEALVGKQKGDTFELDDKVGKDAVHFQVSVHDVAEITLPEVNAAFAQQFGRKDADDLKQAIHDQLEHEKEDAHRRELETKVLDEVMKKAKVDLPESLVEEELNRRLQQLRAQFGAMYEQVLKQQNKTEDELRKDFRADAEKSVKAGLVLGEIAKRENFGNDQAKDEDDNAFQRRVVRRTLDFLVASATGVDIAKAEKK